MNRPTLLHQLRLARHFLHLAWRNYQLSRIDFYSGLGDAGWFLHGLVRSMKPDVCVEIGSAHGYSACLIGLALKENLRGHLWAVDPHLTNDWSDQLEASTLESLQRHLRTLRVEQYVTVMRATTADAAPQLPSRVDLAFIDGDHSYDGVRTDWQILRPRMSPFGIVVFHDTLWDRHRDDPYYRQYRRDNMGVPRLLEEIRRGGYPVVTIDQCWGVSIVQPIVGGQDFTPIVEAVANKSAG